MQVRVDDASADGEAITFSPLALVSEARSEHGMRDYDWARYRRFCTAKTRRMRRSMGLTHTDATPAQHKKPRRSKRRARITPAQQSAAAKGTGNEYVARQIESSAVANSRPLELLLFEIEHAWAAAGEAHNESHTRNSKGRARRAVRTLTELEKLVEALASRLSVRDRGQVAAYACYMRAMCAFYSRASENVLRHGAVAHTLLTLLAASAKSGRDEALAHSFTDTLDAPMRYALRDEQIHATDVDAYASETATPELCEETVPGYAKLAEELESNKTTGREPVTLTWRDQTMVIRNADIIETLERVRVEEEALARSQRSQRSQHESRQRGQRERLSHAARNRKRRGAGVTAGGGGRDPYDRVLAALSDAEQIMRTLVDENAAALRQNHSERYQTAGTELRRAHEVILYRLLAVRIARNVRLAEEVEAKAKKRDAKAAAIYERRRARRSGSVAAVTQKAKAPKRARKDWVAKRHSKRALRSPRPARSGTSRERIVARSAAEERARACVEARADQRRLRIIPGINKLLDGVTSSLDVIGGLVIVEGEPDLSSLVEAKRHWYSAQQVLHLALAFSQHGLNAHARLLLQRGELYLRQAAQTLELADGAEEEDKHFSPHLLTSDAIASQNAVVTDVLRSVEKSLIHNGVGDAASLEASRGGRVLLGAAQRHVAFEEADLELAAQVSREHVEETHKTAAGTAAATAAATDADAMQLDTDAAPRAAPASTSADYACDSDSDSGDDEFTDAAYDPRNAALEEEELATERARRAGWFSSWFSRS
ncbi:hypothetical protein MCUN1_003666 [Malassezia cuniculi]|uniref:Signal recognition particle subunit SRP68 n=1 Tax=Malassezia cuniculi TaxID=948313 RepID=A0AAF0J8F4_9BASI|nr:hypothetical protein MCUN1_003666 [Malassezia cuniculi]